jgi:hypothetical protein
MTTDKPRIVTARKPKRARTPKVEPPLVASIVTANTRRSASSASSDGARSPDGMSDDLPNDRPHREATHETIHPMDVADRRAELVLRLAGVG